MTFGKPAKVTENNGRLYPSFVALLGETDPFRGLTAGFIDNRLVDDVYQYVIISTASLDNEASINSLGANLVSPPFPTGNWYYRPTTAEKVVDAPERTVYADVDFGDVLVGRTAERDLIVTNTQDSANYTGTAGKIAGSDDIAQGPQAFDLAPDEAVNLPVTYAPAQRGGDSATVSVQSGANEDRIAYTGNGVAPVAGIGIERPSKVVRVGTVEAIGIDVTNVGDGNLSGLGNASNLRGRAGAISGDPSFSGDGSGFSIGDGQTQRIDYRFAPTVAGKQTASVVIDFNNGSQDGANGSFSKSFDFSAIAVGPEFGAELNRRAIDPGDLINFGKVRAGSTTTFQLSLGNLVDDLRLPEDLIGLTLLGFEIEGPNAFAFDLRGLTPGTVLRAMDTIDLFLDYTPLRGGIVASATQSIFTDVGAGFGSPRGEIFTFALQGNPFAPVPEPGTLGLVGLGLAGLAFIRRRAHGGQSRGLHLS